MIDQLAKISKTLADETRIRIVYLLSQEELTTKEIAGLLNLGQSRASSHLAFIRDTFPLQERREGRKLYLKLDCEQGLAREWWPLIREQAADSTLIQEDQRALQALLEERRRQGEGFLVPGTNGLGSNYCPGRNWESFARAMLSLVEVEHCVDVGVGSGAMSMLLAEASQKLTAIDCDRTALGRLEKRAKKQGLKHLTCLAGQAEDLPLEDKCCDLLVLSQVLQLLVDPGAALNESFRVLKPGGRILILELSSHHEDWVKEKLAHQHLGFSDQELEAMLAAAGFESRRVAAVARDAKPPHFRTLMAQAKRPR